LTQPSHEQIARRAYELFLSRGAQDGLALHDWLQAERELSKQHKRTARGRPSLGAERAHSIHPSAPVY